MRSSALPSSFGGASQTLRGRSVQILIDGAPRSSELRGFTRELSIIDPASIERIGELTEGKFWYQLYHPANPALRDDLLDRAEAAGCKVLCVLCDVPSFGYRPRDIRNGQPEWASAFEPDSRPSWGSGNPGGSGNAWAGVTVRRGSGEVTVNVPGRAPMRLRTAGSQVRQWRVVQADGSVTVSSQQSGMDEVLQNFSLGDGRERHRMNLRDLKGGGAQPEWARGF